METLKTCEFPQLIKSGLVLIYSNKWTEWIWLSDLLHKLLVFNVAILCVSDGIAMNFEVMNSEQRLWRILKVKKSHLQGTGSNDR